MRGVLDLPPSLEPLGLSIAESLEHVSRRFDDQLKSTHAPVQALVTHVERYRGKMLRPTLVLLSGLANRPQLSPDHITAAAVCEMVHMATLVHDDVLDEADVRRRGATINNLHGNEPAVILGDYLFSAAFHLCSQIEHAEAARLASAYVGTASMAMCAGELLQLHNRKNLALTHDQYFQIVAGKTGELIAVSCFLGSMLAGGDQSTCTTLRRFGMNVGIAFQIQDDLLDLLGSQDTVGKSVHKDLDTGKLTLPVIHHLESASPARRAASLELLRTAAEGRANDTTSSALASALAETNSINYASTRAALLVKEAISDLHSLPDTPARHMLTVMANAVIDRSF
jgi:octaprenyl-diphosphate synthase